MTFILTLVLSGIGVTAVAALIVQLFKQRVSISVRQKANGSMPEIGFMDEKDDYSVPEVHLSDQLQGVAIGRVKMGERDDNAHIEILLTDPDDDSVKPQYQKCGYITPEGFIYRQTGGRPEKIGYTARPSDPQTPSVQGERTWKKLWLKRDRKSVV